MLRLKIFEFSFTALLALLLVLKGHYADESCSNMWDEPTSGSICAVQTSNGNPCMFPFTYQDQEYNNCIINGPSNPDQRPQCMTSSTSWGFCVVPTDAVVKMVTTVKDGGWWQNGASLNGGTMLWISGLRFANNLFTTSPTAVTSNQVILTDGITNYNCEIHPDKVTTTQVTCYTPAMKSGTYNVRVIVNGNLVPTYQHVNVLQSVVTVSDSSTPKITSISPVNGPPNSFVTIQGDFKTLCYSRDVDGCSDDGDALIKRVFFGGTSCNMVNPSTNEVYADVTQNQLTCKLDGSVVGFSNSTMLVDQNYGRSLTDSSDFLVSGSEKIYNYLSYATINSVSTNTGGVLGGTILKIVGGYFYSDSTIPAEIKIGGTQCEIISYNKNKLYDSELICMTAAKPGSVGSEFMGGLGVTLIQDNLYTSSLSGAQPSPNAVYSQINDAQFSTNQTTDITVWLKGYIYISKTSKYDFSITTNGAAVLYLSSDASSANKGSAVSLSGSQVLSKNLVASTYYYFEVVASKQSGDLSVSLNARMYDTSLIDQVSSNVKNEIQNIRISSTIVKESFSLTYQSTTIASSASEVQTVSVTGATAFALRLDGVDSAPISFQSTGQQIQAILNDMPNLNPNLASVELISNDNGLVFKVTFSIALGDVSDLEIIGEATGTVTENTKGIPDGTMIQVQIENGLSPLINANSIDTTKISSAISSSFGIRCPNSIQVGDANTFWVDDAEDACTPGDQPANNTAFCGKCARTSVYDLLRNPYNKIVPLVNNWFCFAYNIKNKLNAIGFSVTDQSSATYNVYAYPRTIADGQWHYLCTDVYAAFTAARGTTIAKTSLYVNRTWVDPYVPSAMFDVARFSKTKPIGSDDPKLPTTRRLYPTLQIFANSLSVTADTASKVTVSYRPINCSCNLLPVSIKQQFAGTSPVLIEKVTNSTPPVTGTFDVTWNSITAEGILANSTTDQLSSSLNSINGLGATTVTRSLDCAGYRWSIKWNTGGDKPALSIASSSLIGNSASVSVSQIQDGSAYISPIRGDMLKTYKTKPQVTVTIAGIPASCTGNCDFDWLDSQTPVVNTIDATNPSLISITGTGFDSTPGNNLVMIGTTPCTVSSASSTQLQCVPGQGNAGTFGFTVNVANKGLAQMNDATQYTFQLRATDFTPTQGGTGGGLVLNITGTCFTSSSTVTIDGISCPVLNSTYSWITCAIPANPTTSDKTVDIIVTDGSNTVTLSTQFFYNNAQTPVATNVQPLKLSVLGGETITIDGTNLPTGLASISIGSQSAKVLTSTSTQMTVESPKMNPGIYSVNIPAGNLGNTKVSNKLEYVFYVSSFSPKVGSIRGGTLVTIYGDGFSSNCSLNNVQFGNSQCSPVACTANSIQCQTSPVNSLLAIDNGGRDPTYGLGYAWSQPYLTINQGDSVKWTWKAPVGVQMAYKVEQTETPSSTTGSGFSSGSASTSGSFTYQFNKIGTFYYWSGFVDANGKIALRGIINVQNGQDTDLAINVTQGGIQAQQCSFPFTYNSQTYSQCTDVDQSFNWCSPTSVANGQVLSCDPANPIAPAACSTASVDLNSCNSQAIAYNNMRFTSCQVATIDQVSTSSVYYDTVIEIQGTGFSANQCENQVFIGGKPCAVSASTTTSINCSLGLNSGLMANKKYDIQVLVNNIGFAIPSDSFPITFLPIIDSLSSSTGSVLGGSKLTIFGDGFTGVASISIGNAIFYLTSANTTMQYVWLGFSTIPNEGDFNISVALDDIPVLWRTSSSYSFSTDYTPTVSSITPTTANGPTPLTITGTKFGSETTMVDVKVGNQSCVVSAVTDTEITCQVAGVDLGQQNLTVNIMGAGLAQIADGISVTGTSSLSSVTPTTGSIHGGTEITLSGNGFTSDTVVMINSKACNVISATVSELKCITSADSAETYSVSVSVGSENFADNGVTFELSSTSTPNIDSISPTTESSVNSALTITGTGFSDTIADLNVTIGNSTCQVTSASTTQIVCTLPVNRAGTYKVVLNVKPYGFANQDKEVTYSLQITSISNPQSGLNGGIVLKIEGNGFSPDTTVTICSNPCSIINSTQTAIYCVVPPSGSTSDSTCSVTVSDNSVSDSEADSFNYVASITPQVSSASPLRGGSGGGVTLTIAGTNFPTTASDVQVSIAGSQCDIISVTSTEIKCATGYYSNFTIQALIQVYVKDVGLATNTDIKFEYIDLWSSKWTWGGTSTPQQGEVAVINKGQTIFFDDNTPVLKGLIINGGSLIFDDNQDVHLQAEYIIIVNGGKMQVGTSDAPFTHKATITMWGSVRSIELPIFGAKVIAVRNGTLDIHGQPVGVTWSHLGESVAAGSSQIKLKEAVSWPVGSQIVIATTGDKFSPGQSEVRTIVSVSSDKTTFTLDQPLAFAHLAEMRTVSDGNGKSYDVWIRAEVGLLTRNVLFRGHNDDSWNSLRTAPACPDGFNPEEFATQTCFLGRYGPEIGTDAFGATIMASADMSVPKSSTNPEPVIIRLSNVELFHVGQSFRLGRYAIHFHMNGDMPSSYVRECAIHQSFNRAVNIHATNFLTIERNVIYDIMGGAYFLEDGVEYGNKFLYNLAVFVRTSSSLLNEDVTPAAFWVTNPNNTYQHNAVAGGTHFGFWYRLLDNSDGPSFRSDYCPKKQPMGKFFNNSVHSTGRFGLWVFPGYNPSPSGNCWDSTPSQAKFEKFTSYLNDKGGEWEMSSSLQFREFVVYDHYSAGITTQTIKYNQDYNTGYRTTFYSKTVGALVADSIIIGNSQSNPTSNTPSGLVLAWDRGELVSNVTFINFPDPDTQAMRAVEIIGRCVVGCGGWTTQFEALKFNNVRYRTTHRWDWDLIYQDLDGSLTGTTNAVVVYADNITQAKSNCQAGNSFRDAVVCSNTKTWVRMAYNNLEPEYVVLTNVTNSDGNMVSIPLLKKRLTHPKGYMIALEANQEYTFIFDEALFPTNVSYSVGFWGLKPSEYIMIKHRLSRKPDQVDFGSLKGTESTSPLTSSSAHGSWNWNNDTQTLTYIIANSNTSPFQDFSMDFAAYKCRYVGCAPPVSPALIPPVTQRAANFRYWSNLTAWYYAEPGWGGYSPNATTTGMGVLPVDGDRIKIPKDVYIVVDCPLPYLKLLQIEGILEFDNGRDHRLVTDMLFINGGQLIVGWENKPILTNVEIVITGQKNKLNFTLPDEVSMIGGKGIGVYGGLDLHGRPRQPSWTRLATTALAGSRNITVEQPVDWMIGESIVITTTSYFANHSEVFIITGKTADNKTLSLNTSLVYDHLAFGETLNSASYKIAAGVGLLSRNIKVIGAEYGNQTADLYGLRTIVSDYSALDADSGLILYYKGYARISDAEFVHPGQFSRNTDDDSKFGILFSNLGAYNTIRPSYVKNSAFHHGFGTAIGIYGSSSIPILNNVVYFTIDIALDIKGSSNIIKGNLITTNFWASTFVTWEANFDKHYWAAINVQEAESVVLEDNLVAGSERVGINLIGDVCEGDSLGTNYNHSIRNNAVYATLAGVATMPDFLYTQDSAASISCSRLRNFTIFKSFYWGIYYQSPYSLIEESNVLVDNQVSLFSMIIQPSPMTHELANKFHIVRNSIVVGQSSSFNCTRDVPPSQDISYIQATSSKAIFSGANSTGKIGITWANFLAGGNGAPFKPWAGIMTYNALNGLLQIEDVTFAHFDIGCNGRDYAISTNSKNDDGQHPVTITGTSLVDVNDSSKIWIHRPNLDKINPSDCVDMDCDGLKKNLLTDLDGSFLGIGANATVTSQAEFGWGSQQRGLGDFRIPAEALAYPNGSMMQPSTLYRYPGIVRDENLCTNVTEWQAWRCANITYKMLLIESMDNDTEMRRLSPVAILSDNGYIDLINGPQDHGWCGGFTCQRRISTFMALIASNKSYDVFLTSTVPNQIRFRILDADASFKVRLSLHYTTSNRIDVYMDGNYVQPTNAYTEDGSMKLYDPNTNLDTYMPTPQSQPGTNLFLKSASKVYFTIDGAQRIDLKIGPVLFLKFGMPAITPEEFFNPDRIVEYFAALLDIDPKLIRSVQVVRATRRKRDTGIIQVSVFVYPNPAPIASDINAYNAAIVALSEIHANVTNRFITGQLNDAATSLFNVTFETLAAQRVNSTNATVVEINQLGDVQVLRQPSGCSEQLPCTTQPIVVVLDKNGNPLKNLGNDLYPLTIVAELFNCSNTNATLIYQTTATISDNGTANFERLGISAMSSSCRLRFKLNTPTGVNATTFDPMPKVSNEVVSSKAQLGCKPLDSNMIIDKDSSFSLSFAFVDPATQIPIHDINWSGKTWQTDLQLFQFDKCQSNGKLSSDFSYANLDSVNSKVDFGGLSFNEPGMYIMRARVQSSDNDYNFNCYSKAILIKESSDSYTFDDSLGTNVVFKFDYDYPTLVAEKKTEHVIAQFHNCVCKKFGIKRTGSVSVYAGSVVVASTISTSNPSGITDLSAAAPGLDLGLGSIKSVSILDTVVKADSSSGGSSSGGSSGGSSVAETAAATAASAGIIAGIVVGALVVVAALAVGGFVGFKYYQKKTLKGREIFPTPRGSPTPPKNDDMEKAFLN